MTFEELIKYFLKNGITFCLDDGSSLSRDDILAKLADLEEKRKEEEKLRIAEEYFGDFN